MAVSRSPFKFRAKIARFATFYGVDIPASVTRAMGVRGYVPVVGTANRAPFRSTMSPRAGGLHRLFLNAGLRAAARVGLGDVVDIALRVDPDPPRWPTPEDLADALRDAGVLEAFESHGPGMRNMYLKWIEQAVHEATRAKRIARVVEVALARHEWRLDRDP